MRWVEQLAREWGREREAKELAHRELRESRANEVRLRKVILDP
jgi:hypothetical protein